MGKYKFYQFVDYRLSVTIILVTLTLFNISSCKQQSKPPIQGGSIFNKDTNMSDPLTFNKDQSLQDTVYSRVDENPQFTGGFDAFRTFLKQNLQYPAECKKDGIEGNVLIMITIEKNGSVSNPEILRSATPLLDNEALRICKILPKFEPGRLKGIPVRVEIVVPINFKL